MRHAILMFAILRARCARRAHGAARLAFDARLSFWLPCSRATLSPECSTPMPPLCCLPCFVPVSHPFRLFFEVFAPRSLMRVCCLLSYAGVMLLFMAVAYAVCLCCSICLSATLMRLPLFDALCAVTFTMARYAPARCLRNVAVSSRLSSDISPTQRAVSPSRVRVI